MGVTWEGAADLTCGGYAIPAFAAAAQITKPLRIKEILRRSQVA